MPGKRIKDLTPKTTVLGSEVLAVDDGTHVQGVTVDILKDFISTEILSYTAPKVAPTLSSSVGKNGETYSITINFGITAGSEAISSITVSDGTNTITKAVTDTSHTFTGISSNKTFTVRVSDGKKTVEASRTITFVYPFYHGILTFDPSSPQNEDVSVKGEKSYTYSMIDSVCHIAYPETYGDIRSIRSNEQEYIDNFTKSTAMVGTVLYNVYTKSDKCSGEFTFTFKF